MLGAPFKNNSIEFNTEVKELVEIEEIIRNGIQKREQWHLLSFTNFLPPVQMKIQMMMPLTDTGHPLCTVLIDLHILSHLSYSHIYI